ncbi:MAG: HlyD family secretion protein [Bacteroidota bacterium]|nr:HlyD family secretion protein [Bacteroidota bacterium]
MAEEATTEVKKTTPRTIIIRVIIGIVLITAGYFGFKKIMYELHHETTDNAQIEAKLVPILPRVAGYIKTLNVEDYAIVKKDSLLAEIDDTELQLQLREMEADVAQAQTDIENAKASIVNAEASLNSSKSNLDVAQTKKDKALTDFNRDQNLYNDGAITKKQLDDSRSNLDVVNKQFETTKNDVNVSQTRMGVIHAQLNKADAIINLKRVNMEQQKLKISYTKIYATTDGRVGKRNVDLGQFVQAGSPLFTIVNDEDYWVVANFKETQIHHMKLNDAVEIKIDAYPDLTLKGKIIAFSDATGAKFSLLPPDNASGNFVKVTQRIPVRIEIENAAQYKDKLHAGMSLDVSVAY